MAATDFLTEARLRSAKPKARPYKLRDGGGLFLLITPANGRLWRLRYKIHGRESMLGLGTYPATSLKTARARRAEAAANTALKGVRRSCPSTARNRAFARSTIAL